ncbi:MAG: prepilin-type N-terminal cleavage/methylation domain-containing protein [Bacilli bacterium]
MSSIFKTKKQGFTLIELLAVIVILAIILAIAVPSITSLIENQKILALEIDAKMLFKAMDYKSAEDTSFDPISLNEANIQQMLNVSASNYDSLEVTKLGEDEYFIFIKGKDKWEGLKACGTPKDITVGKGEDFPLICKIYEDLEYKNGSSYYVGGDPNNWIEFGEEDGIPLLWRIIKRDHEGIKIIYEGKKNNGNQPIENGRVKIDGKYSVYWDENNNNKWNESASIKETLDSWYTGLSINNKYINPIKWCIGAFPNDSDINQIRNYQCKSNTFGNLFSDRELSLCEIDESELVSFDLDDRFFDGKTNTVSPIGMINVLDYLSTSSSLECLVHYSVECGKLDNEESINFLYKPYMYWTMNANGDDNNSVYIIDDEGEVGVGCYGTEECLIKEKFIYMVNENCSYHFNCFKGYIDNNNEFKMEPRIYSLAHPGFSGAVVTIIPKNDFTIKGWSALYKDEKVFSKSLFYSSLNLEAQPLEGQTIGDAYFNVRPVLNLKNNIIYDSGTGKLTKPYKIK